MKKWLLAYAAGTLGALGSALFAWFAGQYGLTRALDVSLAPALSPAWLYPQLVWGGLWGFLFLLPLLASRGLMRAAVLALGPALVQLFVVYPYIQGAGVGGLSLGLLTPVVIYLLCLVWALITALVLKLA